jgi:hypothetical protein
LNHLKATIPAERFNYEVFAGEHQAAPVETMNRTFTWLMANTLEQEYAIIGKVKVRDSVSYPEKLLSGVTISAGSGYSTTIGNLNWTWWDPDSGYFYTQYSIRVIGTGTYALTAHKEGYLFTPAPRVVGLPPEAWDQDFEMLLGPTNEVFLPLVLR